MARDRIAPTGIINPSLVIGPAQSRKSQILRGINSGASFNRYRLDKENSASMASAITRIDEPLIMRC
jgi:hypothetical protein